MHFSHQVNYIKELRGYIIPEHGFPQDLHIMIGPSSRPWFPCVRRWHLLLSIDSKSIAPLITRRSRRIQQKNVASLAITGKFTDREGYIAPEPHIGVCFGLSLSEAYPCWVGCPMTLL